MTCSRQGPCAFRSSVCETPAPPGTRRRRRPRLLLPGAHRAAEPQGPGLRARLCATVCMGGLAPSLAPYLAQVTSPAGRRPFPPTSLGSRLPARGWAPAVRLLAAWPQERPHFPPGLFPPLHCGHTIVLPSLRRKRTGVRWPGPVSITPLTPSLGATGGPRFPAVLPHLARSPVTRIPAPQTHPRCLFLSLRLCGPKCGSRRLRAPDFPKAPPPVRHCVTPRKVLENGRRQ